MNASRLRLFAGLAAALVCVACGNKGPLFLPGGGPDAPAQGSTEPPESGERGADASAPGGAEKDEEQAR